MAGYERQCPAAARSGSHQERPAEARQERQADLHVGKQMDRRQPPRRAGDLASRVANVHHRSPGGRRRLGRKTRHDQLQPVSGAAHRAGRHAARQRPGSTTCTESTRTTPTTSFAGWRITGNIPATRSTMRWCWAVTRASAKTLCWSRSSTPSDRGIFRRSHRPI